MATSLDFQRQDGAVSRMDREFKNATKDPSLLPAYFEKCKFSEEDQAWWQAKENVTKDNIFRMAFEERASHGLLFARMKNWACENWHQYQVLIRGTPGVADEMAVLMQAYSANVRKHNKMENTGMTAETQKNLEVWRKVYKHLIRAERVVESVGVAIRKASVDRVERMRAKRLSLVGPWSSYLNLETSDLIDEATDEERAQIQQLQFDGTHTLATAKLLFNAVWTDKRKTKLIHLAKELSGQMQLPTPPPFFAYDMSQPVMDGILSAPPQVPLNFLTILPSEPDSKFYTSGVGQPNPPNVGNKRARQSSPISAPLPVLSSLQLGPPADEKSADANMDSKANKS